MRPDAGPVSRALLTLELVQAQPGITAERLADRLGVSERAARRYVGMLREAGIPIESTRGPYGGYRAGRGLRMPPLVFTATEATCLVMAVLDGHHAASDPADPVGSALGKLIRALPEPVAETAEAVRRTAAAAPDRAAVRPDPAIATALVRACGERRLARVEYASESGREWTVDVEPWAVVVRHGRWYLLCLPVGRDGSRSYRIDRVRGVEVLDQTFHPPVDLDPVAALEESLGTGWEHVAEVLVDATPDVVAHHLPRTLGRFEPTADGRTRVVGSTSNPAWYAHELTALPTPYRVVGGDALLAAAREVAARLVAATERPGAPDGPGS